MKKLLLILLVMGLVFAGVVACGGSDVEPDAGVAAAPGDADNNGVVEDLPQEDEIEGDGSDIIFDGDIVLPGEGEDWNIEMIAEYFSITGSIESVEVVDGMTHIAIEDTDGNPAVLVLDAETVFPFADTFDVGDVVTGWYLTNAPMIAIWPPQYTIAVLAVDAPDDVNIRVDRFYPWGEDGMGQMISQDETLVFTADEDTEIILANGDDFSDGDLQGRRIVVIYGMSTRSIPEITVASKLIVLYESIVPL